MKPRLGRDLALELGERALAEARTAGADQAEIVLMAEDSALTRYADSRIHQNVAECNVGVGVRAVKGRRVAVATGNQSSPRAVTALAARAAEMARHSPEDSLFSGLPSPPARQNADQDTYYASTAAVGPENRAQTVQLIAEVLAQGEARGYGVVTQGVTEVAVVSSVGVTAYQAYTDAWLSVIARRPRQVAESSSVAAGRGRRADCSGYASACGRNWADLDPRSTAETALAKASVDPFHKLKPGKYTVLLEGEAVADLLSFLGGSAFNGLRYLEGRSLYSGHLGETRYPQLITLLDDPLNPRGINLVFDFEGIPKAPLTLIDKGTVRTVVWDSKTAWRAGCNNTAHALPAPNPYGPVPLNLSLATGQLDRQAILRELDRGLLITRLHYVNEVDSARTLLTGMTRDGTFWVEQGEIVAAVQDLRWLASVDEVLKRTVAVGSELRLVSEGPGYGLRFLTGRLVPSLLVEGFHVTGSAEEAPEAEAT